jgi:UDP-N-acetylglucosamine acyltransferase
MPQVHSTAIVDSKAELGDVTVGPYAVIGAGVQLADGVQVGPHAVLQGPMSIGVGTKIHAFASLGGDPQDLKYAGENTRLEIGARNIIREYVSMNRATGEGSVTRVGDDNLFMANSHVAHDCTVGSGCVFANSVAIAGHVHIHDGAVLGGLVGVHQHARVGRLAMVGAGAIVSLDVPPFTVAQGDRARLFGLNVIGLRRAGVDKDVRVALRRAYRVLFGGTEPLRMAAERLGREFADVPEVQELAGFVQSTTRGVCRSTAAEVPEEGR